MAQEAVSKELSLAMIKHWGELYKLVVYAPEMQKKDIELHLKLIERNYSNKVMALVDGNLAYSQKS